MARGAAILTQSSPWKRGIRDAREEAGARHIRVDERGPIHLELDLPADAAGPGEERRNERQNERGGGPGARTHG